MIFRTEHVMGQTTFLQYNILYVVYIKLICLCRKMACKDRSASVILSYLFRNSPSPVDSSTLTSLPRPSRVSLRRCTHAHTLSLSLISISPFFSLSTSHPITTHRQNNVPRPRNYAPSLAAHHQPRPVPQPDRRQGSHLHRRRPPRRMPPVWVLLPRYLELCGSV